MDHEPGDDYVRRMAAFIRNNEPGLAAAGGTTRRRPKNGEPAPSVFNPLGWFASDPAAIPANVKPVILSFDAHHLYYLLMRMESIGIDGVGSVDVRVESASRPMNYISIPGTDNSDALSFRSITSTFSAVSKLSLGGSWWRAPPATVDSELKYIYATFTRLPALRLHGPEPRLIAEMANEQLDRALCLDAFKSLRTLECADVDPRVILGWDRLAVSLESLSIRRSGLEDVGDVLIGSVLDDLARREGRFVIPKSRRSRLPPSRRGSYHTTRLPDSVPEDTEESLSTPVQEEPRVAKERSRSPTTELPPFTWSSLRHLCLAENALTFLPTGPLPHLTSVTHLDLSSNLLVSVPPGLSALYNLIALNLSDNMIDSVLGIYTMLGQVLSLNLSRNRLESICGLERLLALERVDLRHNLVEESAEVGRLSALPNIAEVWVEGNPLTEIEEGYRIRCFDLFWKESKMVLLDGSPPSFYEKRFLTERPAEQMTSSRTPAATLSSPPVFAVNSHSPQMKALTTPAEPSYRTSPTTSASTSQTSQTASPQLAAVVAGGRRKKNRRVVDLDGFSEAGSSRSASHARGGSETGPLRNTAGSPRLSAKLPMTAEGLRAPAEPSSLKESEKLKAAAPSPLPPPKFVSKHTRRQTEFTPASPPASDKDPLDSIVPSSPPGGRRSSGHQRSATISSKAATRRARVSASVYEPPPQPGGEKGDSQMSEAEAFRARIEALRSDMGDGWLKVFNQSHLASPPPVTSG
ncbi:hypothetical protein PHLGIDRAFT_146809 [Phlebiopsis gigantea 11061_1 CR5-6]|uniref:Uncharacterized protein n=1 Tax=Phlebiopsis gigantea (strain 11061_1 CR5-6) TaxID=745531 RepID=A0A0C3S5G1_PHLG1|nr:hypothetical protein PHLGIDRAFT_146809 [Phlebiopsis gigantea 11061_1 CR5-6]